jgi:hypothetical protein
MFHLELAVQDLYGNFLSYLITLDMLRRLQNHEIISYMSAKIITQVDETLN